MRLPRASGLLLHPTSLPGPFGVGDLGPGAFAFVGMLAEAGQRWWQILPVGPTGYGNSPYQSYSSFAGNPLLISPERLAEAGWLRAGDWADYPDLPTDHVDFDAVIPAKDALFRRAHQNFRGGPADYPEFLTANAFWLDDYALFMALKEAHGGAAWYDWPPALVRRDPSALKEAHDRHADVVGYYKFLQYAFDRQWRGLREACASLGVKLLGDLPIFVALDSADVWANPDLFWLDAQGRATVVAGVPPDYFAETGQLWGNPLYRWEAHAAEGYAWWASRIAAQTGRVDLVRLDHFRGFEAYWEVPAGAKTAVGGQWVPGPGPAFFEAIRGRLGGLPLVAEDLGDISKEVEVLRDQFGLPGMRVLQFGLSGEPGTEFHLPFTFVPHCIAYTGTHDNDTTVGWFNELPNGNPSRKALHFAQRAYGRRFLGTVGESAHWDAIRAVVASVADTAIIPVQDLLGLGSEARMNVPGVSEGNWSWRMTPGQIRQSDLQKLADLTALHGRWNGEIPARYAPPRAVEETVPDAAPKEAVASGGPAALDRSL